jgi:hypothetical protein
MSHVDPNKTPELVSIGMLPLEGTAFTLVRLAPNRYQLTEGGQSIIIQATTLFELSGFIQDREDIEIIIEDAELDGKGA